MSRDPLETALDRRLIKWRDRDLRREGYHCWHGIAVIRHGLGTKGEVRAALLRLVERGRVERGEFVNGVFYRGGLRDRIDVG